MSFLRHDMSTVDPLVKYEPSKGDPSKTRRRIQGKATRDGQYIFIDGKTDEKIPSDARRHHVEVKPSTCGLGSNNFYNGNHSYELKKENPGSFQTMFADPNLLQREREQERKVNLEYVRANERREQERRRQREEQRRADQQALSSHVSSDPWSSSNYKPIAPGQRAPRRRYDYEEKFADNNSYAAKSFGKSNVKRDKYGNIDARRTNDVASLKVHNSQGEDSYVAKVFGKEGFGAPKRSPSGKVQTKRSGKLQSYAIHNESDGTTYNDRVFGKAGVGGPPVRSSSGNIIARHTNVLENSRHHLDVDGDSYNDHVFQNKNTRTNGRRVDLQHQMQKEQHVKHEFFDNVPKQTRNARPHRLSRDPEFSQIGIKNHNAPAILK
eukprot:m.21237 g.21237  ORF g.21237 m.21237 type:complete len:380 (-) comp8702_c0_seq1:1400-2539(-)